MISMLEINEKTFFGQLFAKNLDFPGGTLNVTGHQTRSQEV